MDVSGQLYALTAIIPWKGPLIPPGWTGRSTCPVCTQWRRQKPLHLGIIFKCCVPQYQTYQLSVTYIRVSLDVTGNTGFCRYTSLTSTTNDWKNIHTICYVLTGSSAQYNMSIYNSLFLISSKPCSTFFPLFLLHFNLYNNLPIFSFCDIVTVII